jgi:hypothetical protein
VLVIFLLLIQFLALIWCVVAWGVVCTLRALQRWWWRACLDRYTASYIPFARSMIINCLTGCIKK